MGAPEQFDDEFGDAYEPRANDLDVHTVPMPELPANTDPRDPRALLATLVERSHSLAYEQQQTRATLESIRASVGRLMNAGKTFEGTDFQLATRIGNIEKALAEMRTHIIELEKWREFMTGRFSVIAGIFGVCAVGLTWALNHVHFS